MRPKDLFNKSRLTNMKPLFWLAVVAAGLSVVLVPLVLLDDRVLLGAPIWLKPLKFSLSIAIFAVTFSWLSSFIARGKRWVRLTGIVIVISLSIELLLITAAAAVGQTSHFNVSSPIHIVVWSAMATFISIVLIATLILSVLIIIDKAQPPLVRLGLGLGGVNTAIGMALAFLMTSGPTPQQLADYQGIVGAHTVGIPDGGPGLPFFGWSTVAGDLRVGHFFGLHSIQVSIVLLAIALALPLALRVPLLIVGNATYLGVIAILTWQALRGEPISAPGQLTLLSFGILLSLAIVSFVILSLASIRGRGRRGENWRNK